MNRNPDPDPQDAGPTRTPAKTKFRPPQDAGRPGTAPGDSAGSANSSGDLLPPSSLFSAISERDHAQGPSNARVTLTEYGDFQCPACGEAVGMILDAKQQTGENLRFVYRHFPLTLIHAQAQRAAEASECAGAQGQFWTMHDTLFTHQNALDNGSIVDYADEIGLDVLLFLRNMKDHTYAGRVQEDVHSGLQSGVNGTPAFFINGVRYLPDANRGTLLAALGYTAS